MALSMDEQRILAEIERQLADDDPSLAARLTTFGRPGLMASLRTPRGRVLASFIAIAVVAVLSLMVYSLIPLRVLPIRGTHVRSTAVPSRSEQTVPATMGAAGPAARATGQPAAGKAAARSTPSAGQSITAGKAPAAGQSRAAVTSGGDRRTAGKPATRQPARAG
jgi:hypothetical protein